MAVQPVTWGLGKLAERALAAAAAAMAAAGLSKDGAKDEPGTRTRTADCSQTPQASQCNQCKLGNGVIGQPPSARYIAKTNRINYDYQLQVANMYAGPERFGYVERGDNSNTIVNIDLGMAKAFFGGGAKFITLEWLFAGTAFDGFWRSRCTVVETKANFGHFFDENGFPAKPFTPAVVASWYSTYLDQESKVAPTKPQGKLEWHFMDALAYEAAMDAGIPVSAARYTPYVLGSI